MPDRFHTTPRKLPRQDRAKFTVDAILDATARVLTEEGYELTSTNRVAEVAGVSIGSLYQYFPGREALISALIDRHRERVLTAIADRLGKIAADASLPDVVRGFVEASLLGHSVETSLHQVLAEVPRRAAKLRQLHDTSGLIELLRPHLLCHRSRIRAERFELALSLAVQTVEALTHAVALEEIAGGGDEVTAEIATVVLRYLGD